MSNTFRVTTGQPTIANKPRQEKLDKTVGAGRRTARRSPRARVNFIPDMEQLKAMIDDALTALSRGVYWDRGSIIDIVL